MAAVTRSRRTNARAGGWCPARPAGDSNRGGCIYLSTFAAAGTGYSRADRLSVAKEADMVAEPFPSSTDLEAEMRAELSKLLEECAQDPNCHAIFERIRSILNELQTLRKVAARGAVQARPE